jgi:hypothetical protein
VKVPILQRFALQFLCELARRLRIASRKYLETAQGFLGAPRGKREKTAAVLAEFVHPRFSQHSAILGFGWVSIHVTGILAILAYPGGFFSHRGGIPSPRLPSHRGALPVCPAIAALCPFAQPSRVCPLPLGCSQNGHPLVAKRPSDVVHYEG